MSPVAAQPRKRIVFAGGVSSLTPAVGPVRVSPPVLPQPAVRLPPSADLIAALDLVPSYHHHELLAYTKLAKALKTGESSKGTPRELTLVDPLRSSSPGTRFTKPF